MLYPKNFEIKLGFDKIREFIINNCIGSLGIAHVDQIQYLTDPNEILIQLSRTAEFKSILETNEPFPSSDYFDYGGFLVKASKIDSFLVEEEFHNLKLSLATIEKITGFFSKKSAIYPQLALVMVGVYLNPNLVPEINRVIDEHGKVRDNASPELFEIRGILKQQTFRVRRIMDKILGDFIADGFSNDDSNVTIRSGRLVIPVRAEFKRSVGGFIHDESASGQTAFIEPASVLEINNEIMDLEYREKREIIRILTKLTDRIRPEISNLGKGLEMLGIIDFIRAKARLAVFLNAVMPVIEKKPFIQWSQALHPLLYLAHKSLKKPVIPLDIELNPENRILVISGPNAGGKSVCLTTVGLIQYMMQCGLLVPMSEGSRMGIFNSILVDIGDEQSIENDLSTYSSHLISMKAFIAYASKNTLFLIDEFGTGTEPQFGGAIAESILDHLLHTGAFGVITTHYTNLKKYAEDHKGVINGSMRFDLNRMEPLFRLDIGRPGSSFAIEIAKKIGLSDTILNEAKRRVGFDQVNYEKLLGELENEKIRLSEKIRMLEARDRELKKSVSDYEELKSYLENKKNEIIKEAKSQAREILGEANKSVENTIREIRESQAEKTRIREARANLEKTRKKMVQQEKPEVKKIQEKIRSVIGVGSTVRLKDQDSIGQVISIKGKNAEVAVGHLKIKVKLDQLEQALQKPAKSKEFSRMVFPGGYDVNAKLQNFIGTLDIRGKRGDEAIRELEQYVDQALLFNRKEIKILHGKGDGILRKLVRQALKGYSFISDFHDEDPDHGGAGITVINLK
jgi:DNA mismatch repair protein MutS2